MVLPVLTKRLPMIGIVVLMAAIGGGVVWLRQDRATGESAAPSHETPALTAGGAADLRSVESGDTASTRETVDVGAPEADPSAPRGGVRATRSAAKHYQGKITGRCVDSALQVIEGVDVECVRQGVTARSDAEGGFELQLSLGDRLKRSFHVFVHHEGFGSYDLEARVRAGQTTDLGDIVMKAPGVVSGQVVDTEGVPFAGATVQIAHGLDTVEGSKFKGARDPLRKGESDEKGRFRIDNVPSGEVRAWAGARDMFWGVSDVIEVPPEGEISDVVLQIERMASEDTIDLVVVDPSGDPLPRAKVRFSYRAGIYAGTGDMTPDENGRCRKFLELRGAHDFYASDPAGVYSPAVARGVQPGTHDLVLRLGERRSFTLRARSQNRGAVLRYRAIIDSADGVFRSMDRTETGGPHEDGSVELVTPAIPFLLRVEADGYALAEEGPFDPESMPDTVQAVLTSMPVVSGRVTGDDGGVRDAQVTLHEAIGPKERYVVNGFVCRSLRSPTAEGETDEEGRFEVTLRGAGSYYLRVEAPGYAPEDQGPYELDPEVGASDLDVQLDRGGSIVGRVQVFANEDPSGFIVGVSRADGFGFTRRTSADGGYRFEGLTPGRWLVQWRQTEIRSRSETSRRTAVEKETEIPWNCKVWEGEATRHDLDLRALRTRKLTGLFLLSGEVPSGWTANLSPVGGPGPLSKSAALDSRGHFEVTVSEGGEFDLVLHGVMSNSYVFVRDVVGLDQGDNEWIVDLPAGRIEGRVAPTVSLEEGSLRYEWSGVGNLSYEARIATSSDATFELPLVPVGPGQIRYETLEGEEREMDVTVAEGAVGEISLR